MCALSWLPSFRGVNSLVYRQYFQVFYEFSTWKDIYVRVTIIVTNNNDTKITITNTNTIGITLNITAIADYFYTYNHFFLVLKFFILYRFAISYLKTLEPDTFRISEFFVMEDFQLRF